MPSLQETFDTIVNHLRQQGCKSIEINDSFNEYNRCLYRGSNNTKCAIGCLIPDESYQEGFEGNTPYKSRYYILYKKDELDYEYESKIRYSLRLTELLMDMGHDIDLCKRLQNTHDSNSVDEWEEDFQEVAREFNLTYNPPLSESPV